MPGTPIAFMDKLKNKNGLLSAQLDNVISAAIIIYLYQNGYQGTAFFTAQEEAGKSWRYVYEWFLKNNLSTNELLVLDTSPYETREQANMQQIVLRNRDANARFKSPLLKTLKNFCHKYSIDFSCKDTYIQEKNKVRVQNNQPLLSLGSTELGRIVKESKGQIQGTTLQIPTTGYHTVEETASLLSIKTMLFILKKLYIKEGNNENKIK
jgi:putative aminopeptidase FrvX